MSSNETTIQFSKDDSVGVIELSRPQALNALDTEMLRAIGEQLTRWANDDTVSRIFMHSNLEKAFCAGGDVKKLILMKHEKRTIEDGVEFFNEEYFTDCLVHGINKPVIAWLQGITMGGGVGLSNGAHLRIATEGSTIAMPEVYIGFFPDVGGSRFLSELKGNAGFYLGMSGDRIDARAALAMGLVDIVVDGKEKDAIYQLVKKFDFSGERTKDRERFAKFLQGKLKALSLLGADLENSSFIRRLEVLESPFLSKWEKLENAFSTPNFKTMRDAIMKVDDQRRRSIQSQALAFQLIVNQRKSQSEWPQVFIKEWALAIELLKGENFAEGVRAVLIDKDQLPDWPALTEDEAVREANEMLNRKIENQLAQKLNDAGYNIGL